MSSQPLELPEFMTADDDHSMNELMQWLESHTEVPGLMKRFFVKLAESMDEFDDEQVDFTFCTGTVELESDYKFRDQCYMVKILDRIRSVRLVWVLLIDPQTDKIVAFGRTPTPDGFPAPVNNLLH